MAASFRQGKHRPLLVELGGKLYSLSGKPIFEPAPTNPAFEVFDAVEGTWSALAEPPFLVLGDPDFKFAQFSYIVTGTKIFVSNKEVIDPTPRKSFEKPFDCYAFCFDVAHPLEGWREISNFFQIKAGPFSVPLTSTPFHGRALALDLDLHNGDDLKLVFTYSFEKPTEIQVHVMSYSEETMLYINSLELTVLTQLPLECNEPTEYNFVYLGGQNVCLILSRFSQNRNMDEDQYPEYEYGIQKISMVVIPFTFTYYLDWTLHLNFKVLSTRILEYYTKENSSEHPEVVGCYVL